MIREKSDEPRTFRPPLRRAISLFFFGFAVFFLSAAFWGHQNPGLAAVEGVLFFAFGCVSWRRGLFLEQTGVKIVRPLRLRPLRVQWHDIARFELRAGSGQSPVNLIRASDGCAIGVPTFPRPRGNYDDPRYAKLRARAQAQVDELNRLLEQRSNQPTQAASLN